MLKHVLKDAQVEPAKIQNDPSRYYAAVDIINKVRDSKDLTEHVELTIKSVQDSHRKVAALSDELVQIASEFHEESIKSTRRSSANEVDGENEYDFRKNNYIILMANVCHMITTAYTETLGIYKSLRPPYILTTQNRVGGVAKDHAQLQGIYAEMQFNQHNAERYIEALQLVYSVSKGAPDHMLREIIKLIEPFYKYLNHVHAVEGEPIMINPVVTNVAVHIFENIESHGKVQKDDGRLSAYSVRKAQTISQAIKNENVRDFMSNPDKLHYLVRVAVNDLNTILTETVSMLQTEGVYDMMFGSFGELYNRWMPSLQTKLSMLDSLRFSGVVYNQNVVRPKGQLGRDMRNETVSRIAEMIIDPNTDFRGFVDYVIERKAEVTQFLHEENSFYVCKIGEGNPFLGQAPGALYVEAAERPRGRLEDILGSGFDEIRNFMTSIQHSAKFQDLFVATSPSKSADKSNVLMVGPMGCGKALPISEPVLTPNGWVPIGTIKLGDSVVGSDGQFKKVIGVFPQGNRKIMSVKFTDDAIVRCDLEHLWTVRSAGSKSWHTVTTKQILDGAILDVPSNKSNKTTCKWSASIYKNNGAKRLYIPIVSPINFEEKELLIDPYTLGAWLGDGHSNQGVICGIDDEIFEEVNKKYTQGFKNSESAGFNGLLVELISLNLLGNKHIPEIYLTASINQRIELLRGLLDTDGNAGNKMRRTTFCNSNERLVDDVIALVRSLGGIAKKGNPKIPKYKYKGEIKFGKPSWQVGIKIPEILGVPFNLKREINEFEFPTKYKGIRMIKSIDFCGEEDCVCIKVDAEDSLFVTTDYVLTHNTEVLRAVGAQRDSIGVFAQGSDFLTCWKGEAEKNPKRMFQEGVRLANDSGRHVHFLIDEIDSLLNSDRDLSGNNNLTLEFQILMDGVVRYPNLSVWGATNHIERIPMPMIRRFNKVAIVGELSRDERAELLRRFTSYLPVTAKVKQQDWLQWAELLEGATGDVMRKVADQIWREKMSAFVTSSPEKAELLVKLLNANGKFDVDAFDDAKRESFKQALSGFVIVTQSDIKESIERSLTNIGVRSEIETAVRTYKSAREYLENAKNNPVCQM